MIAERGSSSFAISRRLRLSFGSILLIDLLTKLVAQFFRNADQRLTVGPLQIGITYAINRVPERELLLNDALVYSAILLSCLVLFGFVHRMSLLLRSMLAIGITLAWASLYIAFELTFGRLPVTAQVYNLITLGTNAIVLMILIRALRDTTTRLWLIVLLGADIGNLASYLYPPYYPIDFFFLKTKAAPIEHILNFADLCVYAALSGLAIRLMARAMGGIVRFLRERR